MSAYRNNAFMLSLTMHGAVVAALLIVTYALHTQVKETPKIFELVAGEGDNYAATEAPALGVPGGIKVPTPAPVIPDLAPDPAPPEPVAAPPPPEPVIERAPDKKAVEKALPKPVEPKQPNFAKDVKRIADKREKRLVDADRKKREAAAKAEELRNKRMSKAEFDRQNKNKVASTAKGGSAAKVSKIDAEGIAKGVVGGSAANKTGGAGGKALTREEQSLLDSYISLLRQRLQAAHEKPPGLSDLLEARVQFRIAADGTISAVKIIDSSGSAEFDQSVLAAFTRVRSIGPTPNGKSDVWIITFKMREES